MGDRFYVTSLTVPAHTPSTAPASIMWLMGEESIEDIIITIPDGHNGLTGIRIIYSNQQIIPYANNQYYVGNNRVVPIRYNDYINGIGLLVQGYNDDIWPHTFFLECTAIHATITVNSGSVASGGPAIVPGTNIATLDPLSPDALIGSVPAQIFANLIQPEMVG